MQSLINFFSAKNHSRNRARARRTSVVPIRRAEGTVNFRSVPPYPQQKPPGSRLQTAERQPLVTAGETVGDVVVPSEDRECSTAVGSPAGSPGGLTRASSSGNRLNRIKQDTVSLRSHKRNPFLFKRDSNDNLVMPSEDYLRSRKSSQGSTSHFPAQNQPPNHDSETSTQCSHPDSETIGHTACDASLSTDGSVKHAESEILSPTGCKPRDQPLILPEVISRCSGSPETEALNKATPTFSFSSDTTETPKFLVGDQNSGTSDDVLCEPGKPRVGQSSHGTETLISGLAGHSETDCSTNTISIGHLEHHPLQVPSTDNSWVTDQNNSRNKNNVLSGLNTRSFLSLTSTQEQKRYLTIRTHTSHQVTRFSIGIK